MFKRLFFERPCAMDILGGFETPGQLIDVDP